MGASIAVIDILSLAGVMAFLVMLVNGLKAFGVVKDGDAPIVTQVLQAIAVIILVILQQLGIDLAFVDAIAQNIAALGVSLLAIVPLLMRLNSTIHDGVKGVPVVGFSYSLNRKNAKDDAKEKKK